MIAFPLQLSELLVQRKWPTVQDELFVMVEAENAPTIALYAVSSWRAMPPERRMARLYDG